MTCAFQKRRSSVFRLLGLFVLLLFPLVIGCNNYPLQSLPNATWGSCIVLNNQKLDKGVDILFVIDNSGSMAEEQRKLRNNFRVFIEELLNKDVKDFQIGIITTDLYEKNPQRGQLIQADSATPKIITSSLTTQQITEAFTKNADVGTKGSNFERHFEAVQMALSPSVQGGLIDTANKGFLREGALLAIIFVTDEDDCSHGGKLNETHQPATCFLPPSVSLLDTDGKQLVGPDNKPEIGQMDKLLPTQAFLDFLKNLGREVVVSGLIGNPFVNKPGTQSPIDPQGGCTQDSECGTGGGVCAYSSAEPLARTCGGCQSPDANAAPSFRLFEAIQKSSTGDPNQRWFPICGDNESFQQALVRFAEAITTRRNDIVLAKKPEDPDALVIKIAQPNNSIEEIAKAPIVGNCDANGLCQEQQECNRANQKCYGDGWFYLPPVEGSNQHVVKLSGKAKQQAQPGAKFQISYLCKTTR